MSRARTRCTGALAGVFLASSVLVVIGPAGPVGADGEAEVTGFVFQDFDSDGAYDTAVSEGVATDVPVGGITVRAFDKSGDQVGSATTEPDGTYTLAVSLAAVTNDVRVEFSVPSSGPLSAMRPTFIGPDNGGLLQFVTAPATNVSLGLNVPAEYCQNNPNLAFARLCSGVATDTPTALVTRFDGGPYTPYNPGVLLSDVYTDWSANAAATRTQTGSILGSTWDPRSGRIVSAAYVRRHAAMFESGGLPRPGALFATAPSGTTASAGTGGSTSFLVDLEALLPGDQFSNADPAGPGYIPTNAARGLSRITDGDADGGADGDGMDSDQVEGFDGVYEEVGAAGIGDIDTDGRGRLWVVSLYTKRLYRVSLPADGSAPTSMVSLGEIGADLNCTNGTQRPFSVKYWRNALYLGVVCDGNGDFNQVDPGLVADSNLSFSVVRYDLTTNSWSTFFGPHPLNATGFINKGPASIATVSVPTSLVWNPWTDWYPFVPSLFEARPVPMLSEIEFDRDGSMILGFRDRTGDQHGAAGTEDPGGFATTANVAASGDVYRVCRLGSGYDTSDYAFEGADPLCPQVSNTYSGVSNAEYYSAENFVGENTETSVGMIEQVPGFPSVVANTVNPVDFAESEFENAAGSRAFSNSTGLNSAGVTYSGVQFSSWGAFAQPNTGGEFWESNGMGDVEALCDRAPLQIGSRVWFDADRDGVQDPTEASLAGVTVRLYDSGDDLVGTAITDVDGRYFFVSNTTEAVAGDGDNTGGGLEPDRSFTIRFDNANDFSIAGPLAGLRPTRAGATTDVPNDLHHEIDSDALVAGTGAYGEDDFPYIEVSPQEPGSNSLAFDAGFVWITTSVGDYVWLDLDLDGVQDASEPSAEGVTVTLYSWNAGLAQTEPAVDANLDPVIPVITGPDGRYFFDNLLPGPYVVQFGAPAGYTLTAPYSPAATSATDSDADPTTGLTATFSLDIVVNGITVVDTDPATIADYTAPEIDAGLSPPVVGVASEAWQDYDGDGEQDGGEPALEGVIVELLAPDGSIATDRYGDPVAATTTNGNGLYSFGDLVPGSYRVRFALPAGYRFTVFASAATTADLDSDADPLNGMSALFSVDDEDNGVSTVIDPYGLSNADLVNNTIDVGAIPPIVALGDRAWQDIDADGLQDQGEPPLAGVTVELFEINGTTPAVDASGNTVAPVVTGVDGKYLFDNLYPRTYSATFSLPSGYSYTFQFFGPFALDSNVDGSGFTGPFQIAAAPSGATVYDTDPATMASVVNPTVDAGYVPPQVTVGDIAWQDLDGDGVQELGEPLLAGVVVELLDADGNPAREADGDLVAPEVTDALGAYSFGSLLPGTYRVRFTLPAGYVFTDALQGGNTGLDSDADPLTGLTAPFVVPVGSIDSIDVGAIPPVVGVGDRTWRDLDKDGVQDTGEPPLAGVTVALLAESGLVAATDRFGNSVLPVVTDIQGNYFFDDLIPGTYVVEFTEPVDYSFTTDASPLLAQNSDADPATGTTQTFVVAATAGGSTVSDTNALTDAVLVNESIDAGFIAPVVGIGDLAWQDIDGDGIQDAGEPPLEGVTVELFNGDGTVARDTFGNFVDPATTDSTGAYFFDNLEPGQYRIGFTLPTGYLLTVTSPLDDFLLDSDAHPVTGRTAAFTVSDAVNALDGTLADGTLGNAKFVNTSVDVGGIPPVVGLGDRAWVDADDDGLQDVGEPGLPGVDVELLDESGSAATHIDGSPVAPVTTDSAGRYFFDRLLPGVYSVRFSAPTGYRFSPAEQGALEGADSDPNPVTNLTGQFGIAAFSSGTTVVDTDGDTEAQLANLSIDAGFIPIVAVGDYVWLDSDFDGVQDPGETGLSGVQVELRNAADDSVALDYSNNPVPAATTDGSGYYIFRDLRPGTYYAVFTLANPVGSRFTLRDSGANDSLDSDVDRSTGESSDFVVAAIASGTTEPETDPATDEILIDASVDAGVVVTTSIGDIVWLDSDADGIIDGTEGALPGVTVELLAPSGAAAVNALGTVVPPTTTNGSGVYLFDDVVPGEYRLRVTAPTGHVFSPRHVGSDDTVDSDVDPTTGLTDTFTVFASATGNTVADTGDAVPNAEFIDATRDIGVVPIVAVSNFVWLDANGNGERDAGELPAEGVQVDVLRPNGAFADGANGDPVPSALTAADGSFFVDGLLPGTYRLRFTAPAGYGFTLRQAAGVDIDKDSDAGADGITDLFSIAADASAPTEVSADPAYAALFVNPTVGAGLMRVVAVGDYVWTDSNDNGRQDPGEAPMFGTKVQLLDAEGRQARDAQGGLVGVVFTDTDGRFLFDNLAPGTYRVHFTPPLYHAFAAPDVGSDTGDSDADPGTGLTAPFEVRDAAVGNTVVDNDPETLAGFVNNTVDAGVLPGRLPDTGTSARTALGLASLVLGLGGFLAVVARRRRRLA